MQTMTVTEMERSVLKAYFCTDYGDGPGTETLVFDILDHSGVPGIKARGVLSSLIKKGLVYIHGGYNNDSATSLTPAGIAFCKENNIGG